MSSYVPPHQRNRRQEPKKEISIDVSDKSFPSLGSSNVNQTRWVGASSFSKLASDWKLKEEEEARIHEYEREKAIREASVIPIGMHRLHQLRSEPKFEEDVVIEMPKQVDEWTNAKPLHKPRKVKTLEQIMEQREKEEQLQKEADASWIDCGPEAHETYWDDRY